MELKNLNIYYLIVLITPLLVTGPFFSDFFLVFLVLFFLSKNFNLIFDYSKNLVLLKVLIFFTFYNIIVSVFSENIFA